MPDGRKANTNPAAKDYYHKLIDLPIENDIEPHVTLYHWDLPSALYTEDCPGNFCCYLFSHKPSQFHFSSQITEFNTYGSQGGLVVKQFKILETTQDMLMKSMAIKENSHTDLC